jgi:hypothetical protein
MAALFGKKDEAPGATDAGGDIAQMEAELERLAKLSLPELATEVMSKAFGPDGPGGSGKPGTIEDPTSKTRRSSASAGAAAPKTISPRAGVERLWSGAN